MTHVLPDGEVYVGHVLDSLAAMPAESVQTCITSPPYWGLRKYAGEQVTAWSDGDWAYGLEDTPERWADHTAEWLRAVRRVLRKDATAFVNVGDSYSAGGRGDSDTPKQASNVASNQLGPQKAPPGYKPLDLIHTPSLLIPRLLADGWYLRSVIVWAKPNPMPESVSGTRFECHKVKQGARNGVRKLLTNAGSILEPDSYAPVEWADCEGCATCAPNDGLVLRRGSWRPTEATEWILMLAKSNQYYADGEGVREPHKPESEGRYAYAFSGSNDEKIMGDGEKQRIAPEGFRDLPNGRNLRNVWTFPTEPFPQAHFATELVRRCILASTPDAGCCSVCGAPWARVIDRQSAYEGSRRADGQERYGLTAGSGWKGGADASPDVQTLGWRPTCAHQAEAQPSLVLDPFAGSGTTGVVARSLGRRFALCELSESYVQMALRRLESQNPSLFSIAH